MAVGRISLEVDGVAEFDRTFARYDAVFSDLTGIWPDVRDEFHKIEAEQFASEGSAGGGGRWKDLSDRYKAQKIKRYGSKPILQASGALMESLTGDGPGSYYSATKTEMAVGSVIPYGIYHQRGGGKLPKREPISLSKTQQDRMGYIIGRASVRELKKGNNYVPEFSR